MAVQVHTRKQPSEAGKGFLAEASVVVDGRRLAAVATGETSLEAAASAADRLGRKVHAVTGDPRILVPKEWLSWARAARTGWRWQGDTLVRELKFRDFDDGMSFLEQIARRAEDYKRRPDMAISANHVRLKVANPHHAGITLAELRLAAKVSQVVDELGRRPSEVA